MWTVQLPRIHINLEGHAKVYLINVKITEVHYLTWYGKTPTKTIPSMAICRIVNIRYKWEGFHTDKTRGAGVGGTGCAGRIFAAGTAIVFWCSHRQIKLQQRYTKQLVQFHQHANDKLQFQKSEANPKHCQCTNFRNKQGKCVTVHEPEQIKNWITWN